MKIEVNPTVCKCRNIKKQGIQGMILFIVELFVNVKRVTGNRTIIYKNIDCIKITELFERLFLQQYFIVVPEQMVIICIQLPHCKYISLNISTRANSR